MLSRTKKSTIALRLGLSLALALLLSPLAAIGQAGIGPFAYFPTGDITDSRMLSFGCNANATFVETVNISIAVPVGQPNFSLSFFDGDTSKLDGLGVGHWDSGTRELFYELYFDPANAGNSDPADLVARWFGNSANPLVSNSDPDRTWSADSATMPDNDWWNVDVTTSNLAAAPSGVRFYNLRIFADNCATGEVLNSNLKVAASAPLTFVTARFGFQAVLINTTSEAPIVYPDWPPTGPTFFVDSPTTYDGSFRFFVNLPQNFTQLSIRDGDFDFGTNPAQLVGVPSGVPLTACADVDDPDTPADYSGVNLGGSAGAANPEGAQAFGNPPDDSRLDAFRRGEPGNSDNVGCVRYELTDPNGVVYRNDNPSGSFEWERFRVAGTAADTPNNSDYGPGVAADGSTFINTPTLPSGIWTVDIFGLDLSNLNFWIMDREICASRNDQPACNPAAFLVGDTVYYDTNGNAVQDTDEPGIDGVVVELYRDINKPAILTTVTGDDTSEAAQLYTAVTGTTDFTGKYVFGVANAADYTAVVAASNFGPGGALETLASTTGGESMNGTLDGSDNLFTLDFGYRGTGSIGDFVWLDANADGIQNDGADSGIGGVTVTLTGAGADGLFDTADDVDFGSQVTNADGSYLFDGLAGGNYRVDVDDLTIPAGLTLSTANEPLTVALGDGEAFLDADFGYRGTGSLGDRVWDDADGNGLQDNGELGIVGLTVTLLDAGGSPLAVTTTGADGIYSFPNLPAGTYTVMVDSSTLEPGTVQTYDLDGLGSADSATVVLGAGDNRTDVDFGYQVFDPTPPTGANLGDRVWWDVNSDGVQDAGEQGLNGVTVALLDNGGNVIATDVTIGDGNYLFTDVPAGAYTVIVDFTTLPAGFEPTYDYDGLLSLHSASVATDGSGDNLAIDFGYNTAAAEWCAEETASQAPYHGGSDEHALWLPGIDKYLLFDAATFTELPDGTARLTGSAFSRDTAGRGFDVDVTFTGRTNAAPSGSPKKELQGSAYSNNGGPVETAGWLYYTGFSGTLTGTGDWDGASLSLDRVGPAFQLGFGANGKSIGFGGSGWFNWQVNSQPTSGGSLKASGQGDFNLELGRCADSCAEAAYRGPFAQSNYDHAMYLPAVGTDFEYVPDFGSFEEFVDGTARMTGLLQRRGDSGAQFRVDVTFTGRTSIPPQGNPYLKMTSNAYAVNGGPVNPSSWYYYTGMSGTLTGESDLAGAVLSLTRRGPAFQVGEGANEKNVNFGGSGWFDWTRISQPTNGTSLPASGNGDFNQDFGVCPKDPSGFCPSVIDFSTDANGQLLTAGQVIDDEFAAFGITITSNDQTRYPAMIFDSSNPTGGDPDLGTPHQAFGGPGQGSGGGAGQAGENSEPFGNLLIVSEDGDSSDPDDRAAGGTLTFTFASPVTVTSMTIVDIDSNESMGTIRTFDAGGTLLTESPMQNLGGNSVQEISIGASGVSSMEVHFPKSGAIAEIVFCDNVPPGDDDDDDDDDNPPPNGSCPAGLDFNVDGNGGSTVAGQIIDDEYGVFGISIASQNQGSRPAMIFDSGNPSGGDWDLGTPNQDFSGPGVGAGGSAGATGANSQPLGNVLIISEDGDSSDPDDRGAGGTLTFTFDSPVDVTAVTILDIDSNESMGSIRTYDAGGSLLTNTGMQNLGNNSVQIVDVGATGVSSMEVIFPKSGAVGPMTLCTVPPGDDDDDDDDNPPPGDDDDDDDDNPPPPPGDDDDDDDDNPPPPPGDDDDDDDTPPPPPGDDDDDDDDTPPPPTGDDDDDDDTPPPPPGDDDDDDDDTPPPPTGDDDDDDDDDSAFQGPAANVGTSSMSFWRNNPEHWPTATVNAGGVEYASADAIATFRVKPQGDKTYDVYRNLATARLNIAHGNDDSCVAAAIATADAWLAQNPVGSNVRGNSSTWRQGARAANSTLVQYNRGELCAPQRIGTQGYGYFKRADRWPTASLTVGGTSYDANGGVQMLKSSPGGDQTYVLYRELVGARLNVERGTDASCIADTLAAADLWITRHTVGSNVRGRDGAWRDEGNPLRLTLRDYNRGDLCSLSQN